MLIRKTVNKKIDNGQIKPVHVLGRLTVLQKKPRGRVEKKSTYKTAFGWRVPNHKEPKG